MEGYGDRLARGAASAIFGPNDGKITQEKWNAAFEGFDPEKFKKEGFTVEEGASTGEKERK
jgi:hypothetical protein